MGTLENQLEQILEDLGQAAAGAVAGQVNPKYALLKHALAVEKLAKGLPDTYAVAQVKKDDFGKKEEPVIASPTLEEWADFPALLVKLRKCDVHNVGVALVTLPAGLESLGTSPKQHLPQYGRKFVIQRHPDNAQFLKVVMSADSDIKMGGLAAFRLESLPEYSAGENIELSDAELDAIITKFEDVKEPWVTPIYSSEKEITEPDHREAYGLPATSPIFPLPGNMLDNTIMAVPGIHTPWMYVSEGFGTPFWFHSEDAELASINVVHWGASKFWCTISPKFKETVETLIKNSLNIAQPKSKCDSAMRHLALYIPRVVLDEAGIQYCQFEQKPGQAVITFPYAYHQGFNAGPNVAEAVNFGEWNWTAEGKRFCSPKVCGYNSVSERELGWKGDEEEQISRQFNHPTVYESALDGRNNGKNNGRNNGRNKSKSKKPARTATSKKRKADLAEPTERTRKSKRISDKPAASNPAAPPANKNKSETPKKNAAKANNGVDTLLNMPVKTDSPPAPNYLENLEEWKAEQVASNLRDKARPIIRFRPLNAENRRPASYLDD